MKNKHIKLYEEKQNSNQIEVDREILSTMTTIMGLYGSTLEEQLETIKHFLNTLKRYEVSIDDYIEEYEEESARDEILSDLDYQHIYTAAIRKINDLYHVTSLYDTIYCDGEGIYWEWDSDANEIKKFIPGKKVDSIDDLRVIAAYDNTISVDRTAEDFIKSNNIYQTDPKMIEVLWGMGILDEKVYNRYKKADKYKGVIKL